MRIPILAAATALVLAGCASLPAPLQGTWAELEPRAVGEAEIGTAVRWGGRIVAVRPAADSTCFDLIAQPLTASGAPDGSDVSLGRFRACREGFYDPAVFASNRELTFTGRIDGFDRVRIGDHEYRQPRIAAEVVFLWPERREVDVIVERVPWWW